MFGIDDVLLGAAITGGTQMLGGMFQSQQNAANTVANNLNQQLLYTRTEDFNRQQAELNRQFQTSSLQTQRDYETTMSNTAYQRAVNDMKAAGLNPMMMMSHGAAATTPSVGAASGSAASMSTPSAIPSQRTSPWANLGNAVQSAVATAVQAKTMDKMTDEMANLAEQNKYLKQLALRTKEEVPLTVAKTGTQQQVTGLVREQAETASAEARKARSIVDFAERHPDLFYGLNVGQFSGRAVSGALSPLDSIVNPASAAVRTIRSALPQRSQRSRNYPSDPSKNYDEFYEVTGR